jgi:hypothetical protein
MITAETIAIALKARKTGTGSWLAKCVAHDDKRPSMSITAAPGGKILLCCHAGCPQGAVIQALQDRGLWHVSEARDQVIPWEAPAPQPPPSAEKLYILERLVADAALVEDSSVTYGNVSAFLEEAAQLSYHAVLRVSNVLAFASYAADLHVHRWHQLRFIEAAHEARPW